MNFLKKLFAKKETPITSYADFWKWFQQNSPRFFKVVKANDNVEKNFFDELSDKLDALKPGFFFLTGMPDDNTAELVITADGNPENIVFVEELVAAAPTISNWTFTALKPAMGIDQIGINMRGLEFNNDNLSFYSNDSARYPDEVDITIVHADQNDDNADAISHGVYIYLDNYLGELEFLNNIDTLNIVGKAAAEQELIPIKKLQDFLTWRQKEFVEKYDGVRYDTDNDEYAILEADLKSGNRLVATINTELLKWDRQASHQWMCILVIKYDGSETNGMPSEKDAALLYKIEDEMMLELKDSDGYLNVGRQTADGEREIYFACKDFRKPSKVFYNIQQRYASNFDFEVDIFKDKYWKSLERFHKEI